MTDLPEARLGRSFFSRSTDDVARGLLGCTLVSVQSETRVSGRIVETEAYLGTDDRASHAAMYRRGRESLSQLPGSVYIYRAYGIHMMFNIVAKAPRAPYGALLVRAVEPICGLDVMMTRRGRGRPDTVASGPGNLCQAFAFSLDDHMRDLVDDPGLWIEPGLPPETIRISARIGITRSAELPLRFFDPLSRAVSGSRRGIDWQEAVPPTAFRSEG